MEGLKASSHSEVKVAMSIKLRILKLRVRLNFIELMTLLDREQTFKFNFLDIFTEKEKFI